MQHQLQLMGGSVPVVFGCEFKETGEIFSQEADGIIGLGKSEVSIVNQASLLFDLYSRCAVGDWLMTFLFLVA